MADRNPLELMELMRKSEGQRVENELSAVRRSLYTFEMNYRQFRDLLEDLKAPENMEIWALYNRDQLALAQHEIARLVHNVVAAAHSLLEHTRNVMKELLTEGSDARVTYQARVDSDFKTDPHSKWVTDLRRYCSHKELPFVGASFSFTQSEATHDFFLNKSVLRDFNWSAPGRTYLDGLPDRIDFHAELASYRDKVMEFHRWFDSLVRDVYAEPLNELAELEREYVLLELRASIDMFEAEPSGDTGTRVLNVFMQVLEPDALRALAEIDDPRARLEAAVDLVDESLALPEDLRTSLLALVPTGA